jgi:hypothetical protein
VRRFIPASLAAALVAALGLGFAAGVAYAADQRLYDADNALLKAEALLLEASDGGLTGKHLKQFAKSRDRAILRVQQAREAIASAILAADSGLDPF